MINRSNMNFSELTQILIDLGFVRSKKDKFWVFNHQASGAIFGFRPYRANERITEIDFRMVRKQLDWRGLLNENRFDELLSKATA